MLIINNNSFLVHLKSQREKIVGESQKVTSPTIFEDHVKFQVIVPVSKENVIIKYRFPDIYINKSQKEKEEIIKGWEEEREHTRKSGLDLDMSFYYRDSAIVDKLVVNNSHELISLKYWKTSSKIQIMYMNNIRETRDNIEMFVPKIIAIYFRE
jgi:hypothetical protein